MKKILLLLLILCILLPAFAIEVKIQGFVVNKLDNEVLVNHEVKFVAKNDIYDTTVTYTDLNGYYLLEKNFRQGSVIQVITEGFFDDVPIIYKQNIYIERSEINIDFEIIFQNQDDYFTVSGYIFYKKNGEPIENYPINFYENIEENNKITVYTNDKGKYSYTFKITDSNTNFALLETRGNCNDNWVFYTDTIKSLDNDYSKDFYICHNEHWYMQDFIIEGYVFDSISNQPIVNQSVFIIQKKKLSIDTKIYTNENGFFTYTFKINVEDSLKFDIITFSYCGEKEFVEYNTNVTAFAGTYSKTFHICKKDTINNDCDASFFFYLKPGELEISLFEISENIVINTTWNLGDGSTSNETNTNHTYSEEGLYEVCLKIQTEDGCEKTVCKQIMIGNTYCFEGNVYASGVELPSGIVTIYKYNEKSLEYNYTQFLAIENGKFKVDKIIEGDYLFYAIPFFDIDYNFSPKYIPSYNGDKYEWGEANPVSMRNKEDEININLLKYSEKFYGHAQINGKINYKENVDSEIITVILFNKEGVPMDFRLINKNNKFSFEYLPYGRYKLIAECAGKVSTAGYIRLSENEPISTNIIFNVSENQIDYFEEADQAFVKNQNIEVFPNPFDNSISFSYDNKENQNIDITIYDIFGKLIYTETVYDNYQNITLENDFSNTPKGTYLIHISSDEKILKHEKLLKIK